MATLPTYAKILLDGFKEESDYAVIRSDMDGSLAKQRPRRSLPIVTRSIRIIVTTKAYKLLFDEWVRVDLNGGAGWFTFTDPIDETVKQGRFISGKVSWASPGGVWLLDTSLETLG